MMMPVDLGGKGPPGGKRGRKKTVRGIPVKRPKRPEVEYFRAMEPLLKQMRDRTASLFSIVESASKADVLAELQSQTGVFGARFANAATEGVPKWAGVITMENKKRVERMIRAAMGVDVARIIDTPEVKDSVDAAIIENVDLIKTIPQKHFSKVRQAVMDNYRGVDFEEGSLLKRIQKIGLVSERRAKLIARDQTSKLVSDISRIRQQDAGIESYIWRTSKDSRVVGNPSGKYPKGSKRHEDHWDREGKVFRWDDPPSDGHPGQPINCRCYPQPIVKREKINAIAI